MREPLQWNLSDATPGITLREQGFVLLRAERLLQIAGVESEAFSALASYWDGLPMDPHLRDGGCYRARRHASLRLDPGGGAILEQVRRPHWQPLDYNALHGGFKRWFAPMEAAALEQPALVGIITGLARLFAECAGHAVPFVEVHQFRIDTAAGIGRPTPEGAHRDGVDFVAVILVQRVQVRGGETRVFEANGPAGLRFTIREPGAALLLDDARVIHETTPLQPDESAGYRDTLVLTYRADGFLDPE